MAKKLQAARNTRPLTAAARRTQPVLVRPPVDATEATTNSPKGSGNGTSATAVVAAPVARRTAPALETRAAPKTKTPTTPSNPARTAAALRAGKASTRAAGQAMLRRPLIRAENFGYVIKDLRLIAVIAVVMFVFMLVLHFILPA